MTLYLITGPPCSGKSTWVRERAKTGDIVVDLDRLALAITSENTQHHDYAPHIRAAAIQVRRTAVSVAVTYSRTGTSFIIHAKPSNKALAFYRRYRPHIIELDAPMPVLIKRAQAERPAHIVAQLSQWWDYADE